MVHHRIAVVALLCAGISAGCSSDTSEPGNNLRTPNLPSPGLRYAITLPEHFRPGVVNSPAFADNTPAHNPITDNGATLGRVLFYDRRLSANNSTSCSSCHLQSRAFSDTARFSRGFKGGRTARHTMGLGNARYYQRGRFFWDERAFSLESQVLQPVQDSVEMGMSLQELVTKLSATSFYPTLFADAFGTNVITPDRIALALAQFIRSMVSTGSRFDQTFVPGGEAPNLSVLTATEQRGMQVYNLVGGCARCHGTSGQIAPAVFNNGLDATITDVGAGGGRFKAPSLRNIELTAPYMHDGRFTTLEQVVEHYDNGVKMSPGLDPGLRAINGEARRLNLTASDKAALVAFLRALTDQAFISDPRFADPFR